MSFTTELPNGEFDLDGEKVDLYGENFIEKGRDYKLPIYKEQQEQIRAIATATDIWNGTNGLGELLKDYTD